MNENQQVVRKATGQYGVSGCGVSAAAVLAADQGAMKRSREEPVRRETHHLSELKANRLTRSLDAIPNEDLKAAHERVGNRSGLGQAPPPTDLQPEIVLDPLLPDKGDKNARFMRFGRKDKSKKEKKADRLSTSPSASDRALSGHMPLEKKTEDEKRSTWSRVGWGRMASERRNSKTDSPGGSGEHLVVPRSASSGFSIPDDVMQSKLESMPDIFFQPLVDFPSGASVCPPYIEGPDHTEAEFIIRDTSSIMNAGSSTSSVSTPEEPNARACGISVSTYPRMTASTSNNVVRLGDPVCDCFALRLYQNGAIFCVCDGCGWGRLSVEAAHTVRSVFMNSLHNHTLLVKSSARSELKPTMNDFDVIVNRGRSKSDGGGSGKGKVKRGAHKVMEMMGVSPNNTGEYFKPTIRRAAEFLLNLIAKAHNAILWEKEPFECGTTTVCAGIVVDLESNEQAAPSLSTAMQSEDIKDSKRSLLMPTAFSSLMSPRSRNDASAAQPKQPFKKKGLVIVSVGDCKIYHFSQTTGRIRDITDGNRQNLTSVNDCGGRLGPASGAEPSEPDLRNLEVYFAECEEGDCIWAVSDGVHDNFDPQLLGLRPREIAADVEAGDWESLSPRTAGRIKTNFAISALERELAIEPQPSPPPSPPLDESNKDHQHAEASAASDKSTNDETWEQKRLKERSATQKFFEEMSRGVRRMQQSDNRDAVQAPSADVTRIEAPKVAPKLELARHFAPEPQATYEPHLLEDPLPVARLAYHSTITGRRKTQLNPAGVTRKIVDLCMAQTEPTRSFMEHNPGERQPSDYRTFPGKLDHTTCLAFRV